MFKPLIFRSYWSFNGDFLKKIKPGHFIETVCLAVQDLIFETVLEKKPRLTSNYDTFMVKYLKYNNLQ